MRPEEISVRVLPGGWVRMADLREAAGMSASHARFQRRLAASERLGLLVRDVCPGGVGGSRSLVLPKIPVRELVAALSAPRPRERRPPEPCPGPCPVCGGPRSKRADRKWAKTCGDRRCAVELCATATFNRKRAELGLPPVPPRIGPWSSPPRGSGP